MLCFEFWFVTTIMHDRLYQLLNKEIFKLFREFITIKLNITIVICAFSILMRNILYLLHLNHYPENLYLYLRQLFHHHQP